MKKLKKILIIVLLIFALLFALGYIIVASQGKAIIASQLERALHKKVTIKYAALNPPFNLEIRGLDIAGLANFNSVFIAPSISGLLSGKIVLNELKLVEPKITYEKKPENPGVKAAAGAGALTAVSNPKAVSGGGKYLRLIIKHLNIKNGTIYFIDRTLPAEGIKVTIKDINLNLTDLYIYPRSVKTDFELTGRIPWFEGQEEGKIEAKGWVDLFKKDIEAKVKITDIDGVYLYPYYAAWVDLDKARIKSARLNLTSDVKGRDNNIAAACHLELDDIAFKHSEEASKEERIAEAVLGIFKALNQGKVVVNFTIKTKMTNPDFNFGYIKTAVEKSLQEGMHKYGYASTKDIAEFPGKLVGGTAKGAKDISQALFDGTLGLARKIKETVSYAFQRDR
ncbi:MAG: DUF748 domain-containing protein [Candidatus Omnitrophota bacterium]|jgi:uncharacterized protein involved in outer membrane biogenesis